jgi:hypothetical protein
MISGSGVGEGRAGGALGAVAAVIVVTDGRFSVACMVALLARMVGSHVVRFA